MTTPLPPTDDGGMHTTEGALLWLRTIAEQPGGDVEITRGELALVLAEVDRLTAERDKFHASAARYASLTREAQTERDEQTRRANRMQQEAQHWADRCAEVIAERDEARLALAAGDWLAQVTDGLSHALDAPSAASPDPDPPASSESS